MAARPASLRMKGVATLCLFCAFVSLALGQFGGPTWDSKERGNWGTDFQLVDITSSKDGKIEKAYVHASSGNGPRPLVISLHTWGGSFAQVDPLAQLAVAANWNYVHPDFRGGPMSRPMPVLVLWLFPTWMTPLPSCWLRAKQIKKMSFSWAFPEAHTSLVECF